MCPTIAYRGNRAAQTHTTAGADILAKTNIPQMHIAEEIIRHHHERWDGQGYPDRLAGEDIPLGSRIIGACAAFVAMTSELPYSPARTPEEALDELRRCSGTQFDADVVETLVIVRAEHAVDLASVA